MLPLEKFNPEYHQVVNLNVEFMSKVVRRRDHGRLLECPLCASLAVGGAVDTVQCFTCGLSITKPEPIENAANAWNRRRGAFFGC